MRSRHFLSFLSLSALLAAPVAYADSWKDGYERKYDDGEYKEKYWDGPCKVERKWKENGEYKEKRKCKGGYAVAPPAVYYPPEPALVISPQIVIRP